MIIPEPDTWIDGAAETSVVAVAGDLHDPGTGAPLQGLRASSPAQIERALAAADRVHVSGEWAGLGVGGRAPLLLALADALDAEADAVAHHDALNSGVPLTWTRQFAGALGDTVRGAVALGEELGDEQVLPAAAGPVRLRRVPWGPTALVTPWNAPSAVAGKKMAYALTAGAPVVLKPSPQAPWSAQVLAAAATKAGLPAGTVGVLIGGGDVGAALCADPRIRAISMTGGTATGRAIAAATAARFTRLQLELGSNNPVIVRADADVEAAAAAVYLGMTKLNGQWCEAPRTVHAHRAVADAFVEALVERVRTARLGPVQDEATEIGPMAFAARRDELVAQRDALAAAGHTVLDGATMPDAGWFFAPTVVLGDRVELPGELFGPMITVETVADDGEALARATAAAGGLAGYVFSTAIDEALALGARLPAGEVKINGTSLLDMAPGSAQSFFGGSGIGGHGDRDVLEFFLAKQVVGVDLLDAPI